jgi:DNA-binding NtrC family response regulator
MMALLPMSGIEKWSEDPYDTVHIQCRSGEGTASAVSLPVEKRRSWEEAMATERSLDILLADDEEIVQQTVAGYLRDSGHRVDTVHDALAALKSVEARDYDLAIVDIRMPGMNGLSLMARVQEIRPEMSVIIITGHGNVDMAVQALRLGAAEFLTKPIRLVELDAVLEKSVRLRNLIVQRTRDIEALRKAYDELEARFEEQTAKLAKTNEELRIEITKRKQAQKASRESKEF